MSSTTWLNLHWIIALIMSIPIFVVVFNNRVYDPETKGKWTFYIMYYVSNAIITASYIVHFVLTWSYKSGGMMPVAGCGLTILLGIFYCFITKKTFWP